jgi:hypothetical protein
LAKAKASGTKPLNKARMTSPLIRLTISFLFGAFKDFI